MVSSTLSKVFRNNMRLLFINWGHSLNGGVNVGRVYEILNQFASKRVEIIHITPQKAFEVKNVHNLVVKTPTEETDKKPLGMYTSFIKELVFYSDAPEQEKWTYEVEQYLRTNRNKLGKIDIVYINTSPYCLCLLGGIVKEIFGSKVVVDFQDPLYYSPYKHNLKIFDFLLRRKEQIYLKGCDLLIVNTPSAGRVYKKAYPKIKVEYVTNMIPSVIPKPKRRAVNVKSQFLISYGGSLFMGRDLFPLLKALKKLNSKKYIVEVLGDFTFVNKLRYLYYWKQIEWKNKIDRESYYQYVDSRVDIGLVIQKFGDKNNLVQCIAAKTYDYLALNKPIIYIGPSGDNENIIKKYSKNCCVASGDDGTKNIIKYLDHFKPAENNTINSFYSDFSSRNLYSRLLDLVNNL
jgi:hypothetical protein